MRLGSDIQRRVIVNAVKVKMAVQSQQFISPKVVSLARFICLSCFALLCLASSEIGQVVPRKPLAPADSTAKYLFYLHGRIIEDQGIRPTSEKYGVYEYEKIVRTFSDSGFVVISEARPKNTDALSYAEKVASQIDSLMTLGVVSKNITVVGASKGAGIAVLVSHLLEDSQLRFVILAICSEGMARYWERQEVKLWGRVLHIFDYRDEIANSCQPYWDMLKSSGLIEFEELELRMGLGHGVLYRPYQEWVDPAVRWANAAEVEKE